MPRWPRRCGREASAPPRPGGLRLGRAALRLDDDLAEHHRMEGAAVNVGSGLAEGEGIAVLGVERLGAERAVLGGDAVRAAVVVLPHDGRSRRDRQRRRLELEVADIDDGWRGCRRRLAGGGAGPGGGEHGRRRERCENCAFQDHRSLPHATSGLSVRAGAPLLCAKSTVRTPRYSPSLPAGTFIGMKCGAGLGGVIGNAVERAVWKVMLPSTFWKIWWMWPLSTVTEPKRFR